MRVIPASLLSAAALVICMLCAAPSAAQQPAPAPPATSGPIQPPATQDPQQPSPTPPAPTPTEPTQPTDAAQSAVQPPSLGRVVAADAGIIFLPVRPERAADFEKIMAKLHEALAASADPVRKEQAAGWKVFKAVEPGPNNTALYVFLIDPAVKGTDYAFWKTIYEAFPAEVQELYRLYTAASAGGQTLLNLHLVEAFGAPPAPPPAAPTPKIPD